MKRITLLILFLLAGGCGGSSHDHARSDAENERLRSEEINRRGGGYDHAPPPAVHGHIEDVDNAHHLSGFISHWPPVNIGLSASYG